MAGPEKRRSKLSMLHSCRGRKGSVWGVDKRTEGVGKIRACWYGPSKNTDACTVAHYEVRLLELVLWHDTLSDMVGRPLPRVLCVMVEGVIIWAGRRR